MGQRRSSRELAMQALFYLDQGNYSVDEAYNLFCINFEPSEEIQPFFQELVEGALEHKTEIDTLIEKFSNNWKLSRMSGVDRNVMRMAVFELLFCTDIPSKVSINEAIDIGKKYGTAESGGFINGILDAISIEIENNE